MNKRNYSKWSAVKALLVLPMVAVALSAFAAPANNPCQAQESVVAERQSRPDEEKVDKMPTFRGGDLNAFCVWMQSNVKYPAEAVEKGISGRVLFEFVVDKDGTATSFVVLSSPDKVLSDEVERVFNSSPKEWEAGERDGEKVSVKFTMPIQFAM